MREVNYDERWKVARDLACKINLWPTVENLRHLDAALRRAKAEVLRDLRNTFAPCATGDTRENVDGCGNYDDYYSAGGNDAYRDVVKEIDARAAQIEEGA